jgi:hypothetical protein
MDLVIELDHNGRLWVYTSDGTVLEEAWVPGADETPLELRQTGLCPIEEKYMPGHWASTTLDPQEVAGQLWVSVPPETPPSSPKHP